MSVDSLEDRLRGVLNDEQLAVPGWPDPVQQVVAGITRRRRRRVLTAAMSSLAVLAVPTLVVVLLQPGGPAMSADATIPWIDATAPAPTHFARVEPLPEQPACPAPKASVRAWLEDGGTVAGQRGQTIVLRNWSNEKCTLSGSASITATDPRTGIRALVPYSVGTPLDGDPKAYPANLAIGGLAKLDVVTMTACTQAAAGQRYLDPELVVGETTFPVPDLILRPGCQLQLSPWYVLPALLNAPLTVTMTAPTSVHRGTVLEYEVEVLDALGFRVSLDPCPVYKQSFGSASQWLSLNCIVSRTPPHAPLRFAMRLYVPPDAPLGKTQLEWMAVFADGKVAIANMDTGGVPITVVE